jgi:general secretion pathway protein D
MIKKVSVIVIILALLSSTIPLNKAHAEGTTVQISPQNSTVDIGATFTVNVTVTAVSDLAVWEVQLYYLNSILNCTGAEEGPFLKQGGNTFFASTIRNDYNATHGWMLLGSTLIGPVPGVTGSGTLVTITFKAKAVGETVLDLQGTSLKDSTPPPRHPITHTAIDGTVQVAAHPVVEIDPEENRVPGIGRTFTINITVLQVTDLWGWEFQLFYNSLQMNCTGVEEGPFLKTAGETFFWVVNLTDNYNATHGYIRAFCTLTQVIPGANGNGQIANISFNSTDEGRSILDLNGTKLKKSDGEYMSHETHDASITIWKLGDLGSGIPPAFFEFDGKVDGKDLALFLVCFKGKASLEAMFLGDLGSGIPPAFFEFDGKVDGKDLALFLVCFKGLGPD